MKEDDFKKPIIAIVNSFTQFVPGHVHLREVGKMVKELIDQKIAKAAPEYPIEKINKTDLAILRLAVYELLLEKSQPAKVIIDEAVELAKEYGGDSSPAFVNGALGKLIEK